MSQCSCLNSTSGRRRQPARLIYLWGSPTSEMGQSRKFCDVRVTSALPLKADIHRKAWHVARCHTAANRIFGADQQAVGTSKPGARVAVRLIISSNLGGCSTGMVLRGFSFFRLRPAESYFVA